MQKRGRVHHGPAFLTGKRYLAIPDSYHPSLKNCRDDLIIRTGRGCLKEWLAGPFQAGALDDGLNVSIASEYVEFSAA